MLLPRASATLNKLLDALPCLKADAQPLSLSLAAAETLIACSSRHPAKLFAALTLCHQVFDSLILQIEEKKKKEAFALSVAFSPDGRLLACGGMSGGVALFDVESGKLIAMLEGHYKPVRSLVFTPGAPCFPDHRVVVEVASELPMNMLPSVSDLECDLRHSMSSLTPHIRFPVPSLLCRLAEVVDSLRRHAQPPLRRHQPLPSVSLLRWPPHAHQQAARPR